MTLGAKAASGTSERTCLIMWVKILPNHHDLEQRRAAERVRSWGTSLIFKVLLKWPKRGQEGVWGREEPERTQVLSINHGKKKAVEGGRAREKEMLLCSLLQ